MHGQVAPAGTLGGVSTPTDLADRYGRSSSSRRPLVVGLVVLVAAVFLGWVAWAALFHGNPDARSGLVGFEVVDDHTVEVTVDVRLKETDEAECLVRAYSVDKSTVGEQPFTGVEGRQVATVRTERRATSAEVVGCRAEGQARYR